MSLTVPRRILVALAIAAGAMAAALYYLSTQGADVVLMTRDIDDPRAIAASDVEVRTVASGLVPEGAA
ncbi:MAG TPA: hypothetical protein VM052_04030, partial [Candidatus Limnocylindrales bacterium]|nr:hypothetical protein [Candidatus Limnocylindrales bacterium]